MIPNFDGNERPLRAGEDGLLRCPPFVGDESRLCQNLSSLDGSPGRHLVITFTRTPEEHLARIGRVEEWDPLVGVVHVAGANGHLSGNGASGDPADDTLPPETDSNSLPQDDDGPEAARAGSRVDGGDEASGRRRAVQDTGVGASPGGSRPGTRDGAAPDVVEVTTVDAPGSPTKLGVATLEALEALEHAGPPDAGEPTTACFDSLTALLQYVDGETAFRFLHALGAAFDDAGVAAHYHLDPGAHDEETLRSLEPLFDAVCEYDDGHETFDVREP